MDEILQRNHAFTQVPAAGIFFDQKIRLIPPFVRDITACRHLAFTRDGRHPPHAHSTTHHELMYVDFGGMALELDGRGLALRAGDAIFIRGGVQHGFEALEDMPYQYLNLSFHGSPPESLFGHVVSLDRHGVALMSRMLQERTGLLPNQHELMRALLTELMVGLLRRPSHAHDPHLPEPACLRQHHGNVVARALEIIRQHYASPLTLAQTSTAAGVSASHLRLLLKRETGRSFVVWLHHFRVAAAKHLLMNSAMSVAAVGAAVGYQSTAAFYKVFKRIAGMPPGAYARSLGDPIEPFTPTASLEAETRNGKKPSL